MGIAWTPYQLDLGAKSKTTKVRFDDSCLGPRLVIPDHKLYFIPVDSEAEAAYLTGLLNAPLVSRDRRAITLGDTEATAAVLKQLDALAHSAIEATT